MLGIFAHECTHFYQQFHQITNYPYPMEPMTDAMSIGLGFGKWIRKGYEIEAKYLRTQGNKEYYTLFEKGYLSRRDIKRLQKALKKEKIKQK